MKLRKIITMGLAAIMAVSAMSISAFAAEECKYNTAETSVKMSGNPDIAVAALNDEGNTVYYTYDDLEEMNGEIPTIMGTMKIDYSPAEASVSPYAVNATSYFSRTSVPTSSYYMTSNGYEYSGTFSVPRQATRYSNYYMQNISGRVFWQIIPDRNFTRGTFTGELHSKTTINGVYDDYVILTMAVSSATSLTSNGAVQYTGAYIKLCNTASSAASGECIFKSNY